MFSIEELVKNEAKTFLDVRTIEEYQSRRLPDAINIPLHEIRFRIEEINEMEKPIVVYCLSGSRSSAAVSFLRQAGLEDVYNGGGIGDLMYLLNRNKSVV